MAFAAKATLNQLVTLVNALPGMQEVSKGVPEGFNKDVVAMVAMGPRVLVDKNGGTLQRQMSFLIAFGARVASNEAAAEEMLADLEDALIVAWKADRKLAGTVEDSFPEDRSGDPEYRTVLGQEYRVRAYHMIATQYDIST